MKNFLLVFLTLFFTQTMFSQTESINKFVRKVKRTNRESDKMDLTLPGFLIRFGSNFIDEDDLDGVDLKRITKKLSEIRIVTIDGKRNIEPLDIQDFTHNIHQEGFEDLMMVRTGDEDVRIMVRERNDFIRNIVLLVNEKSENGDFVLLSLEGKFTMDDINKMMENSNVSLNGHSEKKTSKVKTVKSNN